MSRSRRRSASSPALGRGLPSATGTPKSADSRPIHAIFTHFDRHSQKVAYVGNMGVLVTGLLIGALAGITAGVVVGSFWVGFGTYVGVGVIGVFLRALICAIRKEDTEPASTAVPAE